MGLMSSKISRSQQKARTLNSGQWEHIKEHIKDSSDEQPYILITSGPHNALEFDQNKSVALCIGIDEQYHHAYKGKSLKDIIAKDAEAMSEAITNHLRLYLDQVKVRKSSAQPSDCIKKGISTLFVEIARKVQEGGIFIFYFAGHSILVRERCVLA